jgi:hypothetical protein
MKRNTCWIIIVIVVLFLSFSLIPVSHATRSKKTKTSVNSDVSSNRGGFDLKHLPTFSPSNLPRTQTAQTPTPVSGRAVNFALSEPVRNLPDAKDVVKDSKIQSPDTEEGREKNELNGLEIKSANPSAAMMASIDRALQGARPIASETPGVPSLTFDGLSDADNAGLIGGAVAPSDENIDIGPNDVIQTVNDGFRIWDKNGVPKIAPKLISSLFSNLGGICATTDRGDPVVLYDRMADRWFITQFAFVNTSAPPFHQCVAVSRTGDPQGIYFTYDFITPGANFPDYGKFGVWPDGYYMTVNQFLEPGDMFNGVGAYALDRKKMLVGDPTAAFIYFDMNLTSFPEGFNSTLPSDQDGLEAPPVGAPNVFAYLLSDEFEGPPVNTDSLRLFNFHADFTTPANSTFIERPESPLAVAAYDPRNPPGRAEVKEPPPAAAADSLDSIAYHLMHRLQYRNRGGIETLVSSTTVNVSGVNPTTQALYQAGVRYFELQRSTPGGPFLLYDNATFSPDAGNPSTGVNRWLPSAAIDHMGNLAVSYSTSSTSLFPSIWYAGRDFNALGGLAGETSMFTGTAVQLGSGNRWGDYQSLQVDPSDDCTFWTTNQYYNTNSSFNWRTRIGRFKFPTCQAPAQGTLTGTITACDSGAPISGAIVELSNGFSATTKADGTYSINVAPGTYSVTVTDGARNCSPSTNTLTITNGSTTTFNSCLNGTANPIVDPLNPSPVTISGGNGNGIVDADECNTLNVTVKNLGCAPANGVTATLSSSTSGVTIAQPNSPYPNMPIDGTGTNTVPFSVSTAPGFVCGTTINFTLTVNFAGGTSVSNFSLPTCTEVLPDQIVNGSIDPADPKSTAGRIGRNGVVSACGIAKTCPGALGAGGRSFDQYSFTNPGAQAACVTITLASAGGASLIGSAYRNSYNPTDTTFCNNYLGDPGGSLNGSVSWKVDVPAGGTFVVVVMEVNAGTASTPYSVTVSGLRAAPVAGGGVCQTCMITVPANITVNNDPGLCSAIVNFAAPTSSGACGAITLSQASGSAFPKGTTTVVATASSGATASFTITVNDNEIPTVTAPPNLVVTTDPGQCSKTLNVGVASSSDNCPGETVTSTRSDGLAINLPYPKGVTTITWKATDASGNTASANQTVTVNDAELPTINVPANIVKSTDPGACSAVVSFIVTVADNCPGATVVTTPASNSVFPKGTTTVTATATDAVGNTSTRSFTVTVNDTANPVINCPANIVTTSAAGTSQASVTFNPTATDNCAGVVVVTNPVSGSLFNVGTTPVAVTATDSSGNVSTCSFNVTVNQSQAIQFSSPTFAVSEGGGAASLIVTRSGLTTGTATVDYATSDGTARQKSDYIIQLGTLQFAAGETSKTLQIPIVDDNFVEGDETFTVTLSNPTGTDALLGSNSSSIVTIADNDIISPTTNPIDDAQFFVRQQYLDFLNRQPDAAGLAFWTNDITSCGSNAACIAAKRIDVSAAFFLSIEFQETGGFAMRTQRAAFGRKSFDAATRFSYLEFVRAQSQLGNGVIIGQPGAETTLEANKQAYDLQIVNSTAFIARYAAGLSASEFVDALFTSAGVTPTAAERSSAITAFGAGGATGRAAALRVVTDSGSMRTADFSPQFVLMQYYGYLRRNPTDPPDSDDSGYQFWLAKLNSFGGDFRSADMVKAFITSIEYRARFGP